MNTDSKKTETKQCTIPSVIGSPNRYIMGCDPYDKLNWFQTLLKKTGLFYKNRPKSSVGVFRWKDDGSVEFVKDCL
jgi:hypothetical protein